MALGQKEIRLSIKANTAKFEEQLKKLPGVTDKEAKKMARQFARQFDKAEQAAKKSSRQMANSYKGSFGKMGKAAQNFQKVLAAGVFASAAAGVFKLANSASEYVDKVGLMSRQTGLASETLIGMEFAAEAAGTNIDQLQSGLNAFVMKAGQAANIGGASAAVFERLGVSVKDAGGELRSTDEIFRDTINAIAGLDSASEKATTAAELFGARGAKLAAVFADGTGTLDEWTAQAREAGLVMDGEALKASEDMDRGMAELKLTIRAVVQETGEKLIPAMILVTKAIGDVIGKVADAIVWWDKFTDSIFGNIEGGQTAQDNFAAMEKALIQVIKAGKESDATFKTISGVPTTAVSQANQLATAMEHLGDISVKVAQGYELDATELRTLNQVQEKARDLANELGMNFDELAEEAKTTRIELREVGTTDFDELKGELEALGAPLSNVSEDADKAADKLAALNRSFELEALARVDEPLAKFQKEIDRVNEALLEGLDAQLGHDAILAAVDELNQARLEKEQETQNAIAEMQKKRVDQQLAVEAEAAQARALLQQELFSGSIDLANSVFELAKQQRGITFEQEKRLAIAQAVFNTFVGVTQELKKGVPGIFTGAMVAAQGAIQIGMIRSQTMHAGGMVDGLAGGTPDEVPANLLRGEAVITRAGVDALGGEQAVNAINGGGGMQPQVIVHQYKHRVLDVALRDQLRTDTNLNRAFMGLSIRGFVDAKRRMGHR